MKQAIIEKLFNNQELESSEILEVADSLSKTGNIEVKPYYHQEGQVFEACCIEESDIDNLNKEISNKSKETKSVSEIVEHCEKLMNVNSSYRRLIIIQAIKYMKASNDPFISLFMGL
jgi:wobble nucleotide-excising tRNase